MFTRALSNPGFRGLPKPAAKPAPVIKKKVSLTERIQAQVVILTDKAATLLMPPPTNGSTTELNGSSGAALHRPAKVSPSSGSSHASPEHAATAGRTAELPDTAAAADDSQAKAAAARAKLKNLTHRATGSATAQ